MSRLTFIITAVALSTWSCGGGTVTPDPDPDPVTDVFSGTLTPRGAVTHTFVTSRSGAVEARLSSLLPDATVIVGVSLGTWNGTACQIVLANDKATVGSAVPGAASAGNLCVRIYDVGNVAEAMTYDVQVTHP